MSIFLLTFEDTSTARFDTIFVVIFALLLLLRRSFLFLGELLEPVPKNFNDVYKALLLGILGVRILLVHILGACINFSISHSLFPMVFSMML